MDTGSPSSLEDAGEMATASLSEVLISRGKFLEERELWALCRECCLTLEYVHDCHDLFQSLCISPDTVAFDPEGNVCFLDLDMEPEQAYVAPENVEYGKSSYKSHLYSLGMTLLYATEYNTESNDPRAILTDTFTDLLSSLTADEPDLRPDLDSVIEASEKVLDGESSQEICLRIIAIPQSEVPDSEGTPGSSLQQVTDELTAYLQSQSTIVQTTKAPTEITKTTDEASIPSENGSIGKKEAIATSTPKWVKDHPQKDVNDNCMKPQERNSRRKKKSSTKSPGILRDASLDEEDIMASSSDQGDQTPRRRKQQKGIMLVDVIDYLDHVLGEADLWSICRESILCLQRKKKHLPAYISPDTIMIRESGTVGFKAIPDEKPLEVIYMAPELQQKGILNEKTCLYGLGITLRTAAGVKYSSNLDLPDCEALEILIQSFVHGKPERRPTLETALEMCDEYEKVSEIQSKEQCQRIYKDALEQVNASRASDPMSASNASNDDSRVAGSDQQSSEPEHTMLSSETTQSLHHGDQSECDDNIDEIPSDDSVDDTVTPSSAFKPLSVTEKEATASSSSSSAFKPVAVKPKPVKDQYRVPSAFSSPATHFKPIIIHSHGSDKNKQDSVASADTGGKETDVVAKLREIKHNLLKHRTSDSTENKSEETAHPSSSFQQTSLDKKIKDGNDVTSQDIGIALKHLQNQGQLPSTDVLATAIAQYLQTQLEKTGSGQPSPQKSAAPAESQAAPITKDTTQSFTKPISNGVALFHSQSEQFYGHLMSSHHGMTQQSHTAGISQPQGSNTLPTAATSTTMSTQQVSVPSYIPPPNVPQGVAHASNLHNAIPNRPSMGVPPVPLPYSIPTSAVSQQANPMQYPVPFSGANVPVQFTLIQDPVSGMMQMVPIQYMPMSNSPSSHGQSPMHNVTPNMLPGNEAHLQTTGDNTSQKGKANLNPDVNRLDTSFGKRYPSDNRPQKHDPGGTPNTSYQQNHLNPLRHNPQPLRVPDEANSQSSSPSPSKDSGICLTQQTTSYSKDPLMERLLSSENSQRQRTLAEVVRLLREEFAEDGIFDTGVEDLAIAEYVMALSSLSWDTFCSAITEKYLHLVWNQSILTALYDAIGSLRTRHHHYASKTPPSSRSKPYLHKAIEKADRKRRQSVPEMDSISDSPHQSQQVVGQHRNGSFIGNDLLSRPKSEQGTQRGLWSETSDSTDTEARDKRRRFKKRCELDKTKSSSLHNISVTAFSSNNETDATSLTDHQHLQATDGLLKNNPSVFSKTYTSARPDANAALGSVGIHPSSLNNISSNNDKGRIVGTGTEVKNTNYNFTRSALVGKQPEPKSHLPNSYRMDPNQKSCSRVEDDTAPQSYHLLQAKNGSAAQTVSTNVQRSPNPGVSSSHLLIKRDYVDSSSDNSPQEEHKATLHKRSPQTTITGDSRKPERVTSPQYHHLQTNDTHPQRLNGQFPTVHNSMSEPKTNIKQQQPFGKQQYQNDKKNPVMQVPTASTFKPTPNRYDFTDGSHDLSSDSDFNSSAEMRRLSAKKPELFDDRRSTPGFSTPIDKKIKFPMTKDSTSNPYAHSHLPQPFQAKPRSPPQNNTVTAAVPLKSLVPCAGLESGRYGATDSRGAGIPNIYEPSTPDTRNRRDVPENNRPQYGRSLSAVYNRQNHPNDTGIKVVDSVPTEMDSHNHSDWDSIPQFPEYNNALMSYSRRSQVVYHSAMIQLNLTQEVDTFIHSIDEENRHVIESKLASIRQEISVQRKQRKKTQKFYRKLNEPGANTKNSKGDQNVSDQMLKDMTEMTKKVSFLHLCQTHLQMLYAELYGLDSCYLYSLSASEGKGPLHLQAYRENPYLQFRTLKTPSEEQMTVLQAGTPRGLMSYLYTSSALSNGYIHQFLVCFRYIVTADQLLSFILEKFRAAQSGSPQDPNTSRVQHRSVDLLLFWMEGYYSIDYAIDGKLVKKIADFLKEQSDKKADGIDELFSLYAACRMGENMELMLNTEMDEDEDEDGNYFLRLSNPKRWESFRSLLKRSKSDKSRSGSFSSLGRSKSDLKMDSSASGGSKTATSPFSVSDVPAHTLAEQLTLLEQEVFRKTHPLHFLNSQFQGVGVALTMPGARTPSMSRKAEASNTVKRGLFVGDPPINSNVVNMIAHSQELAHWVSAEILSCGSNKSQLNIVTKFLTVAQLCVEVRNFATAVSILDGLENLVVKQLPVWKNVSSKYLSYMETLTDIKMKLKSEAMWLMSEKDCHVYPTIPCALYAALHLQQVEIGGFTLANGMFKWDKMRSICENMDQLRIFRDHEYGFECDVDLQKKLRRRLSEFSDRDLHAVASTQDNNFRRHSSSSSLSGTLKKVKDKLHSKMK